MPFEIRKLKGCCFCVSPVIELIVWASINLIIHTFLLFLLTLVILIVSEIVGGIDSVPLSAFTFPSVILVEIVYNILVIVACARKHFKLLKFSFALGAVLWIALLALGSWWFATVISNLPKQDSWLKKLEFEVFELVIFVAVIILQGYMLLITCSVKLRLEDEAQGAGYLDLGKTDETEEDH